MQTGEQEISGLGEEESSLESQEVEQNEPAQDEPSKESPKETVRRELEKLKNADGDSSESEGQEQKELSKKPVERLERESDPDLLPPERLPGSQKGVFSKLPKGLRREANKLFKSYESSMTQYNQALSQTKGLMDAIQPYVSEWGMRGVSAAQGVAQLAAAQAKLTDPDPAVRKRTFLALAKQSGINPAELGEGEPSQKTENAELISLREKVQQLESYVGTQKSTQDQGQTVAIVQELESVRQEIDETSGDYRYPELHNEAFLQQTVKPLVSAIKGTVSGISWAEALRKAYTIATGRQPLDSHNGTQTRLPAAEINKQPARVIAPVSVRGRSISSTSISDDMPPPEAMRDPRATTRWALEQLRRGR